MISTGKLFRNLGLLTIGMITGCVLAYETRYQPYFIFTLLASSLPFVMAILIGIAKTTTV